MGRNQLVDQTLFMHGYAKLSGEKETLRPRYQDQSLVTFSSAVTEIKSQQNLTLRNFQNLFNFNLYVSTSIDFVSGFGGGGDY